MNVTIDYPRLSSTSLLSQDEGLLLGLMLLKPSSNCYLDHCCPRMRGYYLDVFLLLLTLILLLPHCYPRMRDITGMNFTLVNFHLTTTSLLSQEEWVLLG